MSDTLPLISKKAENVAEYAANAQVVSAGLIFRCFCRSLIAGKRPEAMNESRNSARQNRANMKYRRRLEISVAG